MTDESPIVYTLDQNQLHDFLEAICSGREVFALEQEGERYHLVRAAAWDPERYTLPDGSKAGFHYEQALKKIAHPVPEDYDPTADDPD